MSPPAAAADDFDAVELLHDTCKAAGWSIEYRQLESGPLQARAQSAVHGDLVLLRETANRRLEVSGEPPNDSIFVLLQTGTGTIRANGQSLVEGDLMMFMPGTELRATTHGPADAISLHLAPDLLLPMLRKIAARECLLGHRPTSKHSAGKVAIDALVALAVKGFEAVETPAQSDRIEQDILLTIAKAVCESSGQYAARLPRSRVEQLRAIDRARDYIDSHLGEPIRMADVCAYAKTSLSTLERLFRQELQLLPTAYIQALRVERPRRTLSNGGSGGVTVAQVATAHGFNHLGRFSAAYRRQFGAYPSEILRGFNTRS